MPDVVRNAGGEGLEALMPPPPRKEIFFQDIAVRFAVNITRLSLYPLTNDLIKIRLSRSSIAGRGGGRIAAGPEFLVPPLVVRNIL